MGFLSSLFGSSKSKPATTTNVISQKLPEEIAPFAKEVLGEAQQLYKANIERGYDPFTGQTIAPFTPEQQRSMEGISGLVGTSRPLQEEALATYRQGAERFTGDTAQQYMSPYQQAVTDIEKREAQRNFEGNILPRLEAQAVGAGAMSGLGSRAGVEFAEAQRNQAQLLSDIQAKGQQAAFQDASRRFEQQKNRERAMAGDVSQLGPAMFASGLQEQGALGAVGEQKQQLAQSALDEAYFKFLEEEQYPQQQLANYSGFVYGNPAAGMVNSTQTGTSTPFQPSFGQSLLGIGSTLGAAALRNPNIFSGFGGGASVPGTGKKEGGKVSDGLAGLVRRQEGKQVGRGDSQFMLDLKNILNPIQKGLETARSKADERDNIRKKNLEVRGDYFFGSADDPEVQKRIDTLENLQLKPEMQKRIEQAGDSPGLPGDFQEGATVEVKETLDSLGRKTLKPKGTASADGDFQTVEAMGKQALQKSREAEADTLGAGMTDKQRKSFGIPTSKEIKEDTAAMNKKYMDFVNQLYPQGQNEFLADALQALGTMFISENKGKAFTDTFNKLQAAGMKRKDARRAAIGKIALENMKRDDKALEKIRGLPKRMRDAVIAEQARLLGITVKEAEIRYKNALARKANRTDPNASKAVKLTDGERKAAAEYTTTTLQPKILSKIESDKTFAARMGKVLGSSSSTAEKIQEEVEDAFEHKAFKSIFDQQLEGLRNKNPSASPSSLYESAAILALGSFITDRQYFGSDVRLR